jgi:two-component system, OmpR family, sensor histidine kinase KdpD
MRDSKPGPTQPVRAQGVRGWFERLFDLIIGVDKPPQPARARRTPAWVPYAWSALVVVLCTQVARIMFPLQFFELDNAIMIYLLGIVLAAIRYGRGPAALASALSVLAINIFFVPRYLGSVEGSVESLMTFAAMLVVAVVISSLTLRTRQQAETERERARRAAALYEFGRDLASTAETEDLLRVSTRHIGDTFNSEVLILMPEPTGQLVIAGDDTMVTRFDTAAQTLAEWALEHQQPAGLGAAEFAGSPVRYVPLIASRGAVGVLALQPEDAGWLLAPDQLHLLETFANQAALAVERTRLAEEAQQAQVQVEAERMRNALLSSISHDLRTPLAAIIGATSTLLEGEDTLDPATRRDLAQAAYDEADRLNRLVRNLLDMTRLESGNVRVNRDWHPLEEIVGVALDRVSNQLGARPVHANLAIDLPLVPVDGVLIEQVLINLLENAAKYTPPEAPIEISARLEPRSASEAEAPGDAVGAEVIVEVADSGPGLQPGDEERVFDKFYRAQTMGARVGAGLGLTICRGIVAAHGGRIWAANRPEGGAVFRFTLPLGEAPPQVESIVMAETPAA